MRPSQESLYKWGLYAFATFLCCVVQGLFLKYLQFWGVFPFVYPILTAVVSTLEGPLSGMVYSLVFGVACDLTISAPIPCFYTLIFPIAGLFAAALARGVVSSGLLSALVTSAAAYMLTGAFYGLIFSFASTSVWDAVALRCAQEMALSLPFALPIYYSFRIVERKCQDPAPIRL